MLDSIGLVLMPTISRYEEKAKQIHLLVNGRRERKSAQWNARTMKRGHPMTIIWIIILVLALPVMIIVSAATQKRK